MIPLLFRRFPQYLIGIPQTKMNRPRRVLTRKHIPHIGSGSTPIVKRKQMHTPQIRNGHIQNILIVHIFQLVPRIKKPQQIIQSISRLDLPHLIQRQGDGTHGISILCDSRSTRHRRRQHRHRLRRSQRRRRNKHSASPRGEFQIRLFLRRLLLLRQWRRPPLPIGVDLPPPIHICTIHIQMQHSGNPIPPIANTRMPLFPLPVMTPTRILIRPMKILDQIVLRLPRRKHRVDRPMIRIRGPARFFLRNENGAAPHRRGGLHRAMLRETCRYLLVRGVRRHVHDFDAGVRLDEGMQMALGVAFDPVPIFSLEDDVMRGVVLVGGVVVVMGVGSTSVEGSRDERRRGFRSDAQSTAGDEVAFRRTEVIGTIRVFLGNDSGLLFFQGV
mmetsp:Transcript_206/g.300  ORF Transcript_206/g.300 Transcript_206/m.300 type:complete len:386 (-) Transcript_206:531-1688(-)